MSYAEECPIHNCHFFQKQKFVIYLTSLTSHLNFLLSDDTRPIQFVLLNLSFFIPKISDDDKIRIQNILFKWMHLKW